MVRIILNLRKIDNLEMKIVSKTFLSDHFHLKFVHFSRLQKNEILQITHTRLIQDFFLIFFAILCLKYLCTTPHIFQ